MKRTIFYSMFAIVIISSCGNFKEEMAEVSKLQKVIAEKHKLENVGISINRVNDETYLSVTLENSPIQDSSDTYKKELAASIGQTCVTNCRSIKLSGGRLVLSEHHNYAIVNTNSSTSYDMHIAGSHPNNTTSVEQTD